MLGKIVVSLEFDVNGCKKMIKDPHFPGIVWELERLDDLIIINMHVQMEDACISTVICQVGVTLKAGDYQVHYDIASTEGLSFQESFLEATYKIEVEIEHKRKPVYYY